MSLPKENQIIPFTLIKKSNLPIKLTPNFIISKKGKEQLKNISGIQVYEPLFITITGKKNWEKEKKILITLFSRKTFNLFEYINYEAGSWMAFLSNKKEFQKCLKDIDKDINNKYYPFRYAIGLGINLEKIRRYSSIYR